MPHVIVKFSFSLITPLIASLELILISSGNAGKKEEVIRHHHSIILFCENKGRLTVEYNFGFTEALVKLTLR